MRASPAPPTAAPRVRRPRRGRRASDAGLATNAQQPQRQIPELKQIAAYFRGKFGNEFFKFVVAEDSAEKGGVPTRVAMKLAVAPPAHEYKVETLTAIANEMGVAWHGA